MAQPQSGTKGRAWLESSQVQQSGLTAREAQAVVAAVLDAIKRRPAPGWHGHNAAG